MKMKIVICKIKLDILIFEDTVRNFEISVQYLLEEDRVKLNSNLLTFLGKHF